MALLCLAGLCVSSAKAEPAPPMQLAALAPVDDAIQPASGPFGMIAAHSGAMSAKWRSLQPAIDMEARILDLCRSDAQLCPAAAASFLAIIDTARNRAGRARIGEINRAINLAIRPEDDRARYGVADIWTTPLMTFALGAGDCEDYAIAKYVALRAAGIAPDDLRIVIVHNPALRQDHAVTAARVDGEWLILDNRHMLMLSDKQLTTMVPLVTLDHEDAKPPVTVAEASRT